MVGGSEPFAEVAARGFWLCFYKNSSHSIAV
jgi:hypothetical protein